MRRVNGWAFRLSNEFKFSESAHFLTFTYDTRYVPITPQGRLSVSKSDMQKYFKRLRKAHVHVNKIKYFLCAEYGSHTERPHYHAIIFNAYLDFIESSYDLGNIFRGDVNPATIYYTLKYMCKSEWKPQPGDDRSPEFQLMSKGLGAGYINERTMKYHHADLTDRYNLPLEGGKKVAMPRYYKEKLYTEQQRDLISKYVGHVISAEEPLTPLELNTRIESQMIKLKRQRNEKL